jgi:hypothetical protein
MLPRQAEMILGFLAERAIATEPARIDATLPHEDDRPFLEVAAATGAPLVTGNIRHFPPDACKDVHVLEPAAFLDLLRQAQ